MFWGIVVQNNYQESFPISELKIINIKTIPGIIDFHRRPQAGDFSEKEPLFHKPLAATRTRISGAELTLKIVTTAKDRAPKVFSPWVI